MQTIKVTFLNKTKLIYIDTISSIEKIKDEIRAKFSIDKSQNFFLAHNNKLLTKQTLRNFYLNEESQSSLSRQSYASNNQTKPLECEVRISLKGGGFIIDDIITALFSIIKLFGKIIPLVGEFFKLFINVVEMIPIIFDPPAFINDVMFGVSWGINKVFSKAMDSITESKDQPKDANEEGPFGDNDQGRMTCLDPTLGMILLLVICPPLAIVYKMGAAGLVSAIICGVLCVKLYYFPGLLFAILHVLC